MTFAHISPYLTALLPKSYYERLRQRGDPGRAEVPNLSRCPPTTRGRPPAAPPRPSHLPGAREPPAACPRPRAPPRRTRSAGAPGGAAEAPDPRGRGEPPGQRSQSHGGPGPRHWLRPSQSRSSPAAVGPGAAAPARTRSPCYALSNSPRYRVMCCCSERRRCRRPWCPGSSAALPGGRRGRGRGSSVQGAPRLRRPARPGAAARRR